MSKGYSVHIGINRIDKSHYGTDGHLLCCENDAKSMQALADSQGYLSSIFLTENATYENIKQTLLSLSQVVENNDILLLTYSGHGSYVEDMSADETDGFDECWILYNKMLLDDDLNAILNSFKEGVRIVVLADCCHSGTSIKFLSKPDKIGLPAPKYLDSKSIKYATSTNAKLYAEIKNSLPENVNDPKASVLLISACEDSQTAYDGNNIDGNSKFTELLLKVWNNGNFLGNYSTFHQKISSMSPASQTPKYYLSGKKDISFELEQVFSIIRS